MKHSTRETDDTASKRFGIGRVGIRKSLKIILTGALLLAATGAMAGLLSSPLGVVYTNAGLATVDIQDIADDTLQIRTDGLVGELSLDASDVPPEFDPPASGCKRFAFDQRLELAINLSLGVVEGHTSGRIATENSALDYRADVRGYATCMPAGGHSCGQIVVDLETRVVLADVSDPVRPGLIRMQTLGSLVRGPGGAHWASLAANANLSGDAGLINSLLETMGEGESCGV